MPKIMAIEKHNQNHIERFMSDIISQKIMHSKAFGKKDFYNYIARNKYPRRNMQRRYAPIVRDVVLRGTDSKLR